MVYDVDRVYDGVCYYYRVVPVVTFIPLYMQYVMVINDVYPLGMPLDEPPPESFNDLLWSPYAVEVLSNYYTSANVGQILYEDVTVGGTVWGEVAGVGTNPLKTYVDVVLNGVFGAVGEVGTLTSIFYTIISNSISHAEFNAGFAAIGVDIVVETTASTYNLALYSL
ncbi:hypothetical protein Hbut_0342 [Hyperthermus butylicus DSM 5456]|uniref:Uncharacterized protein n=1 Tax=Hyperthermus butylicus (strain DSM 5456 / JCM 9403 / PLM1-5) TaxID=415426 RepID=A2BJQ3_HYPBU|nr:hypothetical protein Hbut_0342 [Hyperthermus butylicus DSM 5456]